MPARNRETYKLKIDKPCSEDWNSMTSTGTGKFCSHCAKNVVDFASMSDNEILKFIKQSSGNLCGRLTSQQSDRVIKYIPEQPERRRIHAFLAGVFMSLGIGNLSAQQSDKVEVPVQVSDTFYKKADKPEPKDIPAHNPKRLLHGIISDVNTGESLFGATVSIKEGLVGSWADSAGEYSFSIPDSIRGDSITIEVFHLGYERKIFQIGLSELPLRKDFQLEPRDLMVKGEIYMVGGIGSTRAGFVKRTWWRMKYLFSSRY
jgi:hypothetical protein